MPDDPSDRTPSSKSAREARHLIVSGKRARGAPLPGDEPPPRGVTWQYSYSGRSSGPAGVIAGALVLAAVMAALVLGAVAVTVVLWIALSLVVVGVVVAVVRRIFGFGGRR